MCLKLPFDGDPHASDPPIHHILALPGKRILLHDIVFVGPLQQCLPESDHFTPRAQPHPDKLFDEAHFTPTQDPVSDQA